MRYILLISMLFVTACSNPYGYKAGSLASEENQRRDRESCSEKATEDGVKTFPYHLSNESIGASIAGSAVGLTLLAVGGTGFTLTPQESPNLLKHRQDFIEKEMHSCMVSKGYIYKG